jgi:putative aldouronate transport system substrate-binding protein
MNIANNFALNGAFVALDDKLDKNMPNVVKKLPKDILKLVAASDNKLYGVPNVRDGGARGYWVRQDWLQKLNIQPPKTLDDYYKMLKAFTENDPDGNGKKDTFGLPLENYYEFTAPFGIPYDDWMKDDSGNIVRSSVTPKMKEAITFAAKLYKEGIIDPEYSTQTAQRRDEKTVNSQYGFRATVTSNATLYETNTKKVTPTAKFVLMPIPTAPGVSKGYSDVNYYVEGTATKKLGGSLTCIAKNSKNVDAAVKFLDWMFTDEASTLLTFGVEGIHYTLENGKPKYKPAYNGNENMAARRTAGIWDRYAWIGGYFDQVDNGGWDQSWTPETVKFMKESTSDSFQKLVFFNTPTADAAAGEIDKTRTEIMTKIIMGGISVDEGWNQWLKEFDRLGGNKWTKEVNDLYKARK